MGDVFTYSTNPANNSQPPPDGWPEGQSPATVDNCGRELQAAIAVLLRNFPWLDLIKVQGVTPTRTSGTQFTVAVDVTSDYIVGRRIRMTGSTVQYGMISSSTFGGGITTINVEPDAGQSVPTLLSKVEVSVLTDLSTSGVRLRRTGLAQVSLPSAASIVLPNEPDIFLITGISNISAIGGGFEGRTVQLLFAGVLTILDGVGLALAGNFVTAANSTLSLVFSGSSWYELSRSADI